VKAVAKRQVRPGLNRNSPLRCQCRHRRLSRTGVGPATILCAQVAEACSELSHDAVVAGRGGDVAGHDAAGERPGVPPHGCFVAGMKAPRRVFAPPHP